MTTVVKQKVPKLKKDEPAFRRGNRVKKVAFPALVSPFTGNNRRNFRPIGICGTIVQVENAPPLDPLVNNTAYVRVRWDNDSSEHGGGVLCERGNCRCNCYSFTEALSCLEPIEDAN